MSQDATSWSWTLPGGNPASYTDEHPPAICYNTPGSYDVMLIASSGNTHDTINAENYVSVNTEPLVQLGNDTAICQNESMNLDAGNPSANYLWQNGGVNQTLAADSQGLYWVEVTDTNDCSSTDSIQLLINAIPIVNLTVRQSMSRKGNCWDNAVAESFFKSLKSEWIRWRKYQTINEAKTSVFQYIEGWYNTKRRHSALNYMTPSEFKYHLLTQKLAA